MKNRHAVKAKEKRKWLEAIRRFYPNVNINNKSKMEIAKIEDFEVLLIDGTVDFIIKDDTPIFTLPAVSKYNIKCKYVTVDEGAIQFIVNGADIMAPGIVDTDITIEIGDPVWIKEEKYGKAIATGLSIMKGEEMIKSKSGKAVINIHYVGDKLWKSISKSL